MMGSGKGREGRVMEYRLGQMGQDTKGTGRITRRQGEGSSSMWTMIIMMENGSRTRPMGTGCLCTLMGPGTRGIGRMIIRMGMENNNGLTPTLMWGNTKKARSTVRELISGQMRATIRVTG